MNTLSELNKRFPLNSFATVRMHNGATLGGHYSIISEILSRAVPHNGHEPTFMVRLVPNHPGTLQEIEASRLEPRRTKTLMVHYADVRGVGSFPEDMLRYDAAVPINFTVVDGRPIYNAGHAQPEPLIIAKAVGGAYTREVFTSERWKSFLWHCRTFSSERVTRP